MLIKLLLAFACISAVNIIYTTLKQKTTSKPLMHKSGFGQNHRTTITLLATFACISVVNNTQSYITTQQVNLPKPHILTKIPQIYWIIFITWVAFACISVVNNTQSTQSAQSTPLPKGDWRNPMAFPGNLHGLVHTCTRKTHSHILI